MMGLDHINLVVTDLAGSAAFYGELFGLEPGFHTVLEGAWIDRVTGLSGVRAHCLFLQAPGQDVRLELLQYETPRGERLAATSCPHVPGVRHLAFTVDDLEVLLQRLAQRGITPLSPPVEVPFPVGDLGRKRLCYFLDPDGILVEAAAYG